MKLFVLRSIHTLIWLLMVTAISYILYSGLIGNKDTLVKVSVVLIMIEGLILSINNWRCPLHTYAVRFSNDSDINDTFLPALVFFKGYKLILGFIYLFGIYLLLR